MFIDKKSDVAYLLLNVDNANKGKDGSHDSSAERVDIKYFIRSELLNKNNQNVTYLFMFVRPFDSYDNTDKEGYGKRGGQDLVLIKLEKKTSHLPACLPDMKFQDTNIRRVSLSGYGKYHRASCQTDRRGPMKFHYCQTDPDCLDTSCRPQFSDGVRDYTDCVKTERTPAKWSRLCSK